MQVLKMILLRLILKVGYNPLILLISLLYIHNYSFYYLDYLIYHEYEFFYEKDNINYHGIIDLILEYNDHIDIIDFKLKSITDDNYKSQLYGYKNYIENITNKKVNTYLYSVLNEKIESI